MSSRYLSMILSLLLLVAFQGCIREDVPECTQGFLLKLRHSGSNPESWVDPGEFSRLSLFVYDKEGTFLKRMEKSDMQQTDRYTYYVPLGEGAYQFVVWAGLDEDYYKELNLLPSQSRLDEGLLQVTRDSESRTPPPPLLIPTPLHYGNHGAIHVQSNQSRDLIIDVERITSNIRIIMRGLELQEANEDHSFTIEDTNGTCRFIDASIAPDETISYIPRYSDMLRRPSLTGYFTVMKMAEDRHPLLKLYAGSEQKKEWDLMDELIGKYPEANFDTGNDYEIIFTFDSGYLAVSITINGWEIIEEDIG